MSTESKSGFLGFEIERSLSYELWQPEIGEERALKIVEYQDQPGKKDEPFRVAYCIDISSGEQIAFVLGAILAAQFIRAGVDIGSYVGVRSLPKVKTKSGEMANNWDVFILREPESIPNPPTPDGPEKTAAKSGKKPKAGAK